jgi:hypothetical protein
MNSEAHVSGNLRKMQTRLEDLAYYTLVLDGISIDMNAKIGKTIKLSFDGTINCIACGQLTPLARVRASVPIRDNPCRAISLDYAEYYADGLHRHATGSTS